MVTKQAWKDTKFVIACSILLDHHGLKLEFNNNTNYGKATDSCKPEHAQLDHPGSRKKKNETKDFLEFNDLYYKSFKSPEKETEDNIIKWKISHGKSTSYNTLF